MTETASQTAGPYVHIGLTPRATGIDIYPNELGTDIAGRHAEGARIRVEGRIFDGAGDLVKDALVEAWQANAAGHYAHPEGGGPVEDGFRGWGRVATDFDTGKWSFDTIKPGAIAAGQAPHINLWIVARGINLGLKTRVYFADETANENDPVLALAGSRRGTLIASMDDTKDQPTYRFDIHLQGALETVFFDV